eukprot:sb/3478827/
METIQEFFCQPWSPNNGGSVSAEFTTDLSSNTAHQIEEIVRSDLETYNGSAALLDIDDVRMSLPISTVSDLVFTKTLAGSDSYSRNRLNLLRYVYSFTQ